MDPTPDDPFILSIKVMERVFRITCEAEPPGIPLAQYPLVFYVGWDLVSDAGPLTLPH